MSAADKSKSVTVVIKSVYGNFKVYPAPDCTNALRFAMLTGKKTFDPKDIDLIKLLGFVVTAKSDMPISEIFK